MFGTPLTVEALIRILSDEGAVRSWTIAGYNGSCERVVDRDGLIRMLRQLIEPKEAP